MQIDRLTLENFKKYERISLSLHPRFTLLVGTNGSGKTTVLDALAISLGVWLVEPPDSNLVNSRRNISREEIRLKPAIEGDRIQFREQKPVKVSASGSFYDNRQVQWARRLTETGRTSNVEAGEALTAIRALYSQDSSGQNPILPVLAHYGAGRAWLPSNKRRPPRDTADGGPARRWAAFYDCFSERIRSDELWRWFLRETTAAGVRGGRMRPGFEVVRQAVLGCVPGADGLWFDPDRSEIVLSIGHNPQPFDNLSDGQRMMLALVADIAIKAVTQNAHLLPPETTGPDDPALKRLLQLTPGTVLIDELDVHLHPAWQRRVATDLKRTFPAIQFVCTSHSPQVIGEIDRDEVRLLRDDGIHIPSAARGADSNWILDHVMESASSLTQMARELRDKAEVALAEGDLKTGRICTDKLRKFVDGETGELVRLQSSLEALERLAAGEDGE